MGSIAGLATHLNLLIIFNRSRQRIIDEAPIENGRKYNPDNFNPLTPLLK